MGRHSFLALAVASLFVLAGCSGGGGGGGGGNAGGEPPGNSNPPPDGTPPPSIFKLDETNAPSAMQNVLGAIELADLAGRSAVHSAYLFKKISISTLNAVCGTDHAVAVTYGRTDNDGSGDLSAGDIIWKRNDAACDGVIDNISFTISAIGATADDVEGDVEFDTKVDGSELQGSFHLSYSKSAHDFRWLVTDIAATLTTESSARTLADASIDKRAGDADGYTLTFAGTVDAGMADELEFTVEQPFTGVLDTHPTAGVLILSAEDSQLRLTPAADPALVSEQADYALDESGTGEYGEPLHAAWSSLLRGTLFSWIPDNPPEISNVEIGPANPTTTDQLQVTYTLRSTGYRPIDLTYEWRRNGVAVEGQTFSWLPASEHSRGDVITVVVTADDGERVVHAEASTTILDSPPLLSVIGITPSEPDTTDDLLIDMTVSDADGDPLDTAYVWRRNGSVIDGQTGATLPESQHARGDVISVTVSVNDGFESAEGEASVTILDSPPKLSVSGAPSSVSYGDLVTFNATVSDADGDPTDQFEFKLTHGPAGMTMDPRTGKVRWTASGPMFDKTMDFDWGVTVDDPSAGAASGTVRVEDATRQYPLMRVGIDAPIGPASLRIDDFDGDGDEEMLIVGNRGLYELEATSDGGYRPAWMYPFAFIDAEDPYGRPDVVAIAAGDVDGDGRQEIFAAAQGVIAELDGVDRRAARTAKIDASLICQDLELADLDGDGRAELVCLTAADYAYRAVGLMVLEADDLSVKWQFADTDYGRTIAVGNVDADSALEIVTSAGYVFDGATFANQWVYGPGFGTYVDTGDVDGDGIDEIVAGVDWTAVRAYSATLKSPLWEIPKEDLDSLLIADIEGDGTPEILVGDGQGGNVTAYRYDTSTHAAETVFQISSQESGVSVIGVGDVDGDGAAEIVWGTNLSTSGADQVVVAGLDPDIQIEWTNEDPAQLDGAFVGGELAGTSSTPRAPLFATTTTNSTSDGERLVSMDPVTGDLTLSPEIARNWNRTAALSMSDYDGDGDDEAFLATSDLYTGYFAVYDLFPATAFWTSPLASSQYGYGVAVTHADLTGDSKDELIGITASGVVYVYDVFKQSLVWQSTTLQGGRDVVVADIDGDGTPEILVVTSARLYVYSHLDGPVAYVQSGIYTPPDASAEVRDAVVGDTDGDGEAEILVLQGPSYLFDPASEVVRLNQNLDALGSFDVDWRAVDLSIEPSAFPRKNLLLPTAFAVGGPSSIVAVDARTSIEVWRSPLLGSGISANSIHYVDVTGDGRLRISIGAAGAMYLTR